MKNKTLIIVIIVVVLAVIAFILFKNKSAAPVDQTAAESATVKSAADATSSDAALSQLEKENNAEDFTTLDSDVGAEINTAAQ